MQVGGSEERMERIVYSLIIHVLIIPIVNVINSNNEIGGM
jgi:hypothetical protein